MSLNILKNVSERILLLGCFILLSFLSLMILNKVCEIQPLPYIDEIFHIPQAQAYCNNLWTKWDPKITTLPGLYFISYVLLKPLEVITKNFCNVYSLRFINVLGTSINFVVTYKILAKIHFLEGTKSLNAICMNLMSAFNIALFPPLYFFTFLYYTDVWSVTFVLLMYYQHLAAKQKSKYAGAFFGLLSVSVRQSNILWVLLILGDAAWRQLAKYKKAPKVQDLRYTIEVVKLLINSLLPKKRGKESKKRAVVVVSTKEISNETHTYFFVCLLFIIFLLMNRGVVVGDRRAHTIVFHPMQILYFVDFSAFFGFPFFMYQIWAMRHRMPQLYAIIFGVVLAAVLSELNKLEHPYLLADNRHLAFYIWKRIFGHPIIRRAIIPTYVVASMVLIDLMSGCHFVFRIGLAACIFLSLSLQHLFELRYFILPYIMCRLHFRRNVSVAYEFAYFSLINTFALYMFVNRTFLWSSEPGLPQRIIW